MLKYFFSLLFIGLTGYCLAQDTLKTSKDSLVKRVGPVTKVRLGCDLSRLYLSATSSHFKGGELSLDLNRNRVLYEGHLGFATQSKVLSAYTAVTKGAYYSFGVGKNVFDESDNILLGGVRLAGSNFSFQPKDVLIENPYTQTHSYYQIGESQCSAIWLELVGSMRAKIVGWMLMGFEVRFKGMIQTSTDGYVPYAIPGYGLYRSKSSLGFNYFIYINLPTQRR